MTGPGGGIVFFIDYLDQYPSFCAEGDCNYLEAAPGDASEGIAWCSNTADGLGLTVWDKNAIGAGRTNTIRMLNTALERHCTSGAAVEANGYSNTVGEVVFDDWWLPSLGELMMMYTNLRTAGVGGFALAGFWSSTEVGGSEAYRQNFVSGVQNNVAKDNAFTRVRPVRAF